jgi:hypothetical protein
MPMYNEQLARIPVELEEITAELYAALRHKVGA